MFCKRYDPILNWCRFIGQKKMFDLIDTGECIRFTLELYNLSSALHDRSEKGTSEQVDKLINMVWQLKTENSLSGFTKQALSKDGGGQSGSNSHQKGNNGAAVRQLKASGYEVMPNNAFEMDGGTWELISKVHKIHFSIHDLHADHCLAATASPSQGVSTERSEQDQIDCKARPQGIE